MAINSRYVMFASMDVTPEAEALFNEVYDEEHVPYLLEVPGVLSVTRLLGEPFTMQLGGAAKQMPAASPVYTAMYEVDSPEVLNSPEWAAAVERGRWPTEVRPHTRNRHHLIYKVTGSRDA